MNIDLQTLAVALSITNILQVIVLFAQYRMDKTHRGLGWWAFGGAAGGIGFAFNYLRESPTFGPMALVANNLLFVSGLVFPYIGTLEFFGQRRRREWLVAFYVIFSLATLYFTYFDNNPALRRVMTSISIAGFSFLIARSFFIYKLPSVTISAYFLTGVFGLNAGFFALRALTTFGGGVLELPQTAIYLVTLIGSMLWTFGFIILINQRSNAEMRAAKEEAETLFNELKLAEAQRRESEKRYRLLADHSNDVIWTMTKEGQFSYVSPSIVAMRGFTPEEALHQSREQAFCPDSLPTLQSLLEHALTQTKTGHPPRTEYAEIEQPRKNGSTVWTEVTARAVYDAGGQLLEWVCVSRDITERRQFKEFLQKQATTDELTGISNRRHFLQLAHGELSRAFRLNHPLAIAIMDIDHFKYINDTYGHATGDQVLAAFAKICQRNIRAIDLFARFGGDEFVLLFPETDGEQAHDIVERIRLVLAAQPVDLGGSLVPITISAGVVSISHNLEVLDTLLQRADQALYEAKETGRDRVVVKKVNVLS